MGVGVGVGVGDGPGGGVGVGVGVGVAVPHGFIVELVFRGVGAAAEKSVALVSVSVQPLAPRNTAVVLLGAGVGPLPSKQLAVTPYPATRSSITSCNTSALQRTTLMIHQKRASS